MRSSLRTHVLLPFARRATGGAAAAVALSVVGLVTATTATAGPWLTWSTIADSTAGGVLQVRPAAGTPGSAAPVAQARWGRAVAMDASDTGRVVAYTSQTRIKGRDAARHGLTLVVRGRVRVVLTSGVVGRPDVSPDGLTVTVGRTDGRVVRYEVATGRLRTLCTSCHGIPASLGIPGRVGNVALSPNRRYVAVWGTSDGDAEALSIFRTSDGHRVARQLFGLGEPDDTLAWTPDGKRVGYASIVDGNAGSSWRILLLGVNGTVATTRVTSPVATRLSGPMRLNGAWWFVRTAGSSPTTRVATLLRTSSLIVAPTAVGTVRTWTGSGSPFTGFWSLSRFRPSPLP